MGAPDKDSAKQNVMTKPLPKPVVIGFGLFLAIGILVGPAWVLVQKLNEPEPAVPTEAQAFAEALRQEAAAFPASNRQWVDEGLPGELHAAFEADPELLTRRDRDGWVFVHYAAAACRADLIVAAAELGADLDATTDLGFTPLHMVMCRAWIGFAVTDDEVGSSLYALLDAGANANTHLHGSPAGSPAWWAVDHGLSRILGVFADYGFEPSFFHAPVLETATIRLGDTLEMLKETRLELGLIWAGDDRHAAELIAQYRQTSAPEGVRARCFNTRHNGRAIFLFDADSKVIEVLHWPTIEPYMTGESPENVVSITLESSKNDTPEWSRKVSPLATQSVAPDSPP